MRDLFMPEGGVLCPKEAREEEKRRLLSGLPWEEGLAFPSLHQGLRSHPMEAQNEASTIWHQIQRGPMGLQWGKWGKII